MKVARMEFQADLCFPSAHLLNVGIVIFWFKCYVVLFNPLDLVSK